MKKMKLALVGFRGMVGSVLLERMRAEGDFKLVETTFFSSSLKGKAIDSDFLDLNPLSQVFEDSYNLQLLAKHDIVLTCQGGDYTKEIYPGLMNNGFKGYWIDAASALRMEKDAVIVLDPVNLDVMKNALSNNGKLFVGGNCTVSLM
ncbi:MAG: aspartate-semialdehyde dehydrogenase, partial [Bacteriovoracaceae bacterium]|nr:aspartate-semialdehyde dehydrogenase [Bacteriovoracaceae bacterium]